MKTLAMTALVHEGPMARAYLGLLLSQGYRLDRVILMVNQRDVATGKPVAPWLPTALRRQWAKKIQDLRMNHWPRVLLRRHGQWCEPWLQGLAKTYVFSPAAFDALTERPNYARYSDHVDEVLVDGLSDPSLMTHLQSLPARTAILFTGGGMVPASLLTLSNLRFIHVHPGFLPDVRGADGLLWSILLRGRPGASAFYMSPGLDTGDIIFASDMPLPSLPPEFAELDAASAYRMLYAFVDPILRAVQLQKVLGQMQAVEGLFSLPSTSQAVGDGVTFHFMNERLRTLTFAHWRAALKQTHTVSEEPGLP